MKLETFNITNVITYIIKLCGSIIVVFSYLHIIPECIRYFVLGALSILVGIYRLIVPIKFLKSLKSLNSLNSSKEIWHEDLPAYSKITGSLFLPIGIALIIVAYMDKINFDQIPNIFIFLSLFIVLLAMIIWPVIYFKYKMRNRSMILKKSLEQALLSRNPHNLFTLSTCVEIKQNDPEAWPISEKSFNTHPLRYLGYRDRVQMQFFWVDTGTSDNMPVLLIFTGEGDIWMSQTGKIEDFALIDDITGLKLGLGDIFQFILINLKSFTLLCQNTPRVLMFGLSAKHLKLRHHLQKIVDVFAELEKGGNVLDQYNNLHNNLLKDALRSLIIDVFDLTAQMNNLQNMDKIRIFDTQLQHNPILPMKREQLELIRNKARQQASLFVDVFLCNYGEHGKKAAFGIAWLETLYSWKNDNKISE